MLPVILMARSSSAAMKDGIHYFSAMLTTGFLGGKRGGLLCPGRGEAGRVRLVVRQRSGRFWLNACLVRCCGVSHVRHGQENTATRQALLVAL